MNQQRPTSMADRIRWVLRTTGMTQRELARAAGLADTQISVILKRLDERPFAIELDTVLRIARGADVPYAWLLLGEGQPGPKAGSDAAPSLVPLGSFTHWPEYLRQLHDANLGLPPELSRWVAEVAFPVDAEHVLTPQLILDLAWCRFRQIYGAMAPAAPPTVLARALPIDSDRPRANGAASRKTSPTTRHKPKARPRTRS